MHEKRKRLRTSVLHEMRDVVRDSGPSEGKKMQGMLMSDEPDDDDYEAEQDEFDETWDEEEE